jgi:putative hemolysin
LDFYVVDKSATFIQNEKRKGKEFHQMIDLTQLPVVLVSLIFSGFFSGMEIAFISANKLQIELQHKQGIYSGRILSKFVQYPSRFIGTTLVGNTIALVIYGIFMARMLEPAIALWVGDWGGEMTVLLVQTLISTLIVLVSAEFIPKSLFLLNPNTMLSFFALPMRVIHFFISPVVYLIVTLSKFILVKVLRLEYSEDKPVFRLTDLNNYLQNTTVVQHEASTVEVDTKIFNNALEFKTVRVRECMIPRTEITAVEINDSLEDVRQAFIESGHSKILVYKDAIDDVVGYCHSLALFKKPADIREILSPIIIVPETMLANELMIQFINERKSVALVVDEFGGTSGLVSIEDIIEEIFGEIQDEHDDEDWVEQQVSDTEFLLSARHEIDYLNDKYNWNLPVGDYETLGGLILSETEDLPNEGDTIEILPYTFTIQTMQGSRIGMVKVFITPQN